MTITIETIYNCVIIATVYLACLATAPICYVIKNKQKVGRFIIPYFILFVAHSLTILFAGFTLELFSLTTLPTKVRIVSAIVSALFLIIPNIAGCLIWVLRKKIKFYEWLLLNCYAATPTIMLLLWGCLR